MPENRTLAALFKQTIPDTVANREISFWAEPVMISFAYLTAYTILGDGIKINTNDQGVKDTIREWNDEINIGRQTIDDIFTDSYVDNITQARGLWRHLITDDSAVGIDTARIDPTTVVKDRARVKGYEVYIQTARKEDKQFYTKEAFYNYWKANATKKTSLNYVGQDTSLLDATEESNIETIVIPNDPKYLLEFEFFRRPPISSVLNHLAYKRWILWYMKQYSERFWSPNRIGYVGNPQFYMPESPEEFKKERDNLLQSLLFLKNFGALATPGYNKIEETATNTARSSAIYVDYANFLNEELMFSMMGSMGIRSARGTELATGRVLEQGYLRYAKGIRGRFDRGMKHFYVLRLLPINGQQSTRNQIELRHSPMIIEDMKSTVKAVRDACECLLFEDWNEPRQILQSVFGTIMDELPTDKAKEQMEKFIELNKKNVNPLQAGSPTQQQPMGSNRQ